MEILDTLQTKVRNAVQKIDELQARVNELEEAKRQYEEKMQSLVREIGDLDQSSESQDVGENVSDTHSEEKQDNVYRHQL